MDEVFQFEGFRLQRPGGDLYRRDECGIFVPIAIGSRALDVLGVLVGRPGDLVSRREIIAAVWPSTVVEDSNLSMQIAALRRVLDDGRAEGSCIQTIAGRGYRFVASVTRVKSSPVLISGQLSGNGAEGPAAEQAEPRSSATPSHSRVTPSIALPKKHQRLRRGILAIIAGALCLLAAVVALRNWPSLSPWGDISAPRLSIVVLPFVNLGNDPEQQYLADALTEDLTTEMSRIADMFVISSGTAFTYRNKPVDTKQIGRELGVRYVLEGSLQRSSNRLRINLQLIDSGTSAHLWAERFDRDMTDLFVLQDEITSRIAFRLNGELATAAASHPTDQPDALDYTLKGRAALDIRPISDHYEQAIHSFEQALALDPRSVEARSWLALVLITRVLQNQTETAFVDISRAKELVEQVLAAAPDSPRAHYVRGQILRTQSRCEEAIAEFETAISLRPNLPGAYANLGWCKFLTGSIDEALPLQEKALSLGPRDPFVGTLYIRIGLMELLQSHIGEAISAFEKADNISARDTAGVHAYLAAAFALQGQTERAATELTEARRLDADGRYLSIARLRANPHLQTTKIDDFKSPKIEGLWETTFLAGLRKAGVPEE